MRKYAIPDTNIFLHYDIFSVDWCKELESDEVEIIVCSTVLKELDEKKHDRSQKIVDRAIKNLSIIESHNANRNEIRKNVKLSVIIKEPKIEWDNSGLDSSLNDDRILGFILERRNQYDVLVTNDSTPRIKGKELGISVMKLSCTMLPDPKSEERKEIERMERELQTLKDKIPELSIELISSETTKDNLPKFSMKMVHDLSNEEIESMVSERERELSINFTSFPYAISALMVDQQGYKLDVKKHLDLYRKYLTAKIPIDKERSTVLEMTFVLSCKKAPAEDTYCHIEFQKDFQILDESDLPEIPSEPAKPRPMMSLERAFSGVDFSKLALLESGLLNRPNYISEKNVSLNIDANVIQANIKKISHGREIELCTVYVKLPSLESAKSFEIPYAIHAANLPEPIKRKIPVIIEKIE